MDAVAVVCRCGAPVCTPQIVWCTRECAHRHDAMKYHRSHAREKYERQKRWRLTPSGRESTRASAVRCRQTDKSKRSQIQAIGRRRRAANFLKFCHRLEAVMSKVESVAAGSSAEELKAEVAGWTTERLREEFARGFRLIGDALLRTACVLVELESRGEKVEADLSILRLLRKIGRGELAVEVVVRFAGRPYTLASVSKLPVERQQELLKLSDEEADREVRGGPRRRGHFRGATGNGPNLPTLESLTAKAGAHDAADMCLEIVRANADSAMVARILLPKLEQLLAEARPAKKAGRSS